MSEEKKKFDFNKNLKQGKMGEFVIRDALERQLWVRQVVNVSNDKRFQEKDIDILVEGMDNQFYAVEIKTDYQAQDTGNIAYEYLTSGNKGCLEKTEADWILFYIPELNIAYFTVTQQIRDYVAKNKYKWILKPMGQNSKGYLISISDLKYHNLFFKQIDEVI